MSKKRENLWVFSLFLLFYTFFDYLLHSFLFSDGKGLFPYFSLVFLHLLFYRAIAFCFTQKIKERPAVKPAC